MMRINKALIISLFLLAFQAVAEQTAKIAIVDAEPVLIEVIKGKHGYDYYRALAVQDRVLKEGDIGNTLGDFYKEIGLDLSPDLAEEFGRQSPEIMKKQKALVEEALSQVQQYCRSNGISFAYIGGEFFGGENLYYLDESIENITTGVVQQIKNSRTDGEQVPEVWKDIMNKPEKQRGDKK